MIYKNVDESLLKLIKHNLNFSCFYKIKTFTTRMWLKLQVKTQECIFKTYYFIYTKEKDCNF